jgi:hypothetical protein
MRDLLLRDIRNSPSISGISALIMDTCGSIFGEAGSIFLLKIGVLAQKLLEIGTFGTPRSVLKALFACAFVCLM